MKCSGVFHTDMMALLMWLLSVLWTRRLRASGKHRALLSATDCQKPFKKKKVKLYFVVAGMRKVKTFLPDAYTAADKHLTYTYSFFLFCF